MTDPKITDEQFIAAARAMLDPDIGEVDDGDDAVSRNDATDGSDGAFVKAWVWIENSTVVKIPPPFPIGTSYDGHKIVEVLDTDESDGYQPYLYQLDDRSLDNDGTCWIPVDANVILPEAIGPQGGS